MDEQARRLKELQCANFAAYDMLLYLDTHPSDKKAFEISRALVEKTNKLKCEYEKDFGSLTPFGSAYRGRFDWLDSPWPWEKEASV
jgi:spore coat protein JB